MSASKPSLAMIRNVGIVAHIDAGKTTTTENILFYSGLTHRVGNIDEGTTAMDYLDEERTRGITIIAAAATFPWHNALIHLIDTPGHIDFTAEVQRSMRVIDGAVVIFSGVEGVEAQSEKVWHQAEEYDVPRIAFINKMDRIGASFERVLDEINAKFGDCAVPLQIPVGREGGFRGIVDLVQFKLVRFAGQSNESVVLEDIPEDLCESARACREQMIERLADGSDEIAEMYLAGAQIPDDMIRRTVRDLTLRNRLVPVLTGSAKGCIGIQPLADAIVEYLPSPEDRTGIRATRVKDHSAVDITPDSDAPFTGLVFKVVASTSADLLYVRTYSGILKAGSKVTNSRTGESVGAKQILRLFAKNTEQIREVGPGDIVGIVGPRNCGTGDTICDARSLVAFEPMSFPEPVISMAVEPKSSRDKDRLEEALNLLCREDPTLSLQRDEETGQWLLSGMGELHLEIKLKRLAQEFRVEAKAGEPRVAYRETFAAPYCAAVTFEKTIGDTFLRAGVKIAFKTLKDVDKLYTVTSSIKRQPGIPKAFAEAAERALSDSLRTGGNLGYPLIYVKADLDDLSVYSETTESAIVGAVLKAVDTAIREAGTKILEPLMHLEILTPPETVGDITGYLNPRRAVIHQMADAGGVKRISCEVPLAEMFGFGKALPKLTGGRAAFTMAPRGYQELPAGVADRTM